MKQLVKIARSVTVQNKVEVELDIPQESMFYKEIDYDRIESIFAIIPYNQHFKLIKVEYYCQQFENFSLNDLWTVDFAKYHPLRAIALDIFEKEPFEYKQISKEEWVELRNKFLNINEYL